MLFSIIVPVFNRPDETTELLKSLTDQTEKDFEVIIVEDGSTDCCDRVVKQFSDEIQVKYFFKPNSGPGLTRNFGAERSNGTFLIFLDSDCILPPNYLKEVKNELESQPSDCFGGPDRADESFTDIQKAINYSMTSFLTTGGIRGGKGKKRMDKFYPRSFNLGIRKSVFEALHGFSTMRFGEDIDFSTRVFKNGFSCRLFPQAWVYHKRRTNFKQFFKQVHNFGMARIALYRKYPESLKPVHLLPAMFTIGCMLLIAVAIFFPILLLLPLLFSILILIDAGLRTGSLWVALLAIIATYIQLLGYGSGFLVAWFKVCLLKHDKCIAFEKNFYK